MIRTERPPNFEQILAAFPYAANRGVIFAYGEDIYNPAGNTLPKAIVAHEYKHCARQFLFGADEWWKQYIADSEFRYNEELLGHVAEFKQRLHNIRDRNVRYKTLSETAIRLTARLYNYEPPRTMQQAMRDIAALV